VGAKVGNSGGANSEINVTPLIDVVLVLLIIFMVLTPRTIHEMDTTLPNPNPKPKSENKDPKEQLIIAVYEDGRVALNTKVMEQPELYRQVNQRLKAKQPDKRVVFVDAHPDANYGLVVGAMDTAKEAGATRVGLAKLKDEGPAKPGSATAAPEAPALEEAPAP
jgi:biopolymer transport protein ExbD/biopolymer transport protein TolR